MSTQTFAFSCACFCLFVMIMSPIGCCYINEHGPSFIVDARPSLDENTWGANAIEVSTTILIIVFTIFFIVNCESYHEETKKTRRRP